MRSVQVAYFVAAICCNQNFFRETSRSRAGVECANKGKPLMDDYPHYVRRSFWTFQDVLNKISVFASLPYYVLHVCDMARAISFRTCLREYIANNRED